MFLAIRTVGQRDSNTVKQRLTDIQTMKNTNRHTEGNRSRQDSRDGGINEQNRPTTETETMPH